VCVCVCVDVCGCGCEGGGVHVFVKNVYTCIHLHTHIQLIVGGELHVCMEKIHIYYIDM